MSKSSGLLGSSSKSGTDEVLDTICPKMSFKERLYGFCIVSGIGKKLEL
jgi:sorbitol-specific phosphotransferase system component IIBC